METYSYISENGTVREIADLVARDKNDQQDIIIGGFDARITQAQQKADSVEGIAQAAQTTATNAQTTAQNAQSTASSAQSTANSAQSTANSANTTANNALTRVNTVGGERTAKTAVGTSPSGSTVYKRTWVFTDANQHALSLDANFTILDTKVVQKQVISGVTSWTISVSNGLTLTSSQQVFKGAASTGTLTYYVTITWINGTY